ncbi:MAG: sensor histidine kinase [Selenomonadaceae bacterium]|nr:sensor histidine kinase [Selenomonadaceae bacterium]
MFEEYILTVAVNTLIAFFAFRYSEIFLQRKYENRKKSLILWIFFYCLAKTIYGNLAENFPFYNRFSYAIPHLILFGALQFAFFEKNISRQVFSILSFIAGWEILRFAASPLAHSILGAWNSVFNFFVNFFTEKNLIKAERLLEIMPVINQIVLFATLVICRGLQLAVFYIYLKLIGKNFVNADYKLNARESVFLIAPSATILCVDLTFRLIAYSADNSALMLVYERVPETLILLPAVSLLLLGFAVSSVILFRGLVEGKAEEQKRMLLENSVAEIHTQIAELENIYGDIRGLKHDIRGHVASITAYIRNRGGKDIEELGNYLKGMEETVAKLDFTDRTENPLMDIILHRFRQEAKRKNISVNFNFRYPTSKDFDIYDISVILNNALQNATEAAEKVKNSSRISLRSYTNGSLFFIEVKNNFNENLFWKENSDLPVTTKKDKSLHGLGLENIRRTARKYQGDIEISVAKKAEEKIFQLTVMLYKKN